MRLRIPRTRKTWLVAATVVAFVAYGLTGGCYAERLPVAPGAGQREFLKSPPLPYSVVVTPWDPATASRLGKNPDAYAKAAFEWLERSGAFSSVRLGSPTDTRADFTATPTGLYCSTAVIPVWTGISLGLVPTIFSDSTCREVVFRAVANGALGADSLVVRHHTGGRVVMGWAAIPISMLPGWSRGGATAHPRYSEQARLAILGQSERLGALKLR